MQISEIILDWRHWVGWSLMLLGVLLVLSRFKATISFMLAIVLFVVLIVIDLINHRAGFQ